MELTDYRFYRYLGATQLSSNGFTVKPRDVVGLYKANEGMAYIVSPDYPAAGTIDIGMYDAIRESSRSFTADPSVLFRNISMSPVGDSAQGTPAPGNPNPANPPAQEPSPVESVKAKKERRQMEDAAEYQMRENDTFGSLASIEYTRPLYAGGSANNYEPQPLPKCGTVRLEIKPISELLSVPKFKNLRGYDAPDYMLTDVMENIMPAIGLNVQLPFKRLFFGLTKDPSDGTHLATYTINGIRYGAISISPEQMVQEFGGYNSRAVGQAITHEVAHFVDHTMLRNLDRLRFTQDIRGRLLHPASKIPGRISTVPSEHFATLAELMVWGNSLRKVYTLNGIEIVAKYFENKYVTQSDIEKRKI